MAKLDDKALEKLIREVLSETQTDEGLREAATPVFNALRDDFQIDAQELEQLEMFR